MSITAQLASIHSIRHISNSYIHPKYVRCKATESKEGRLKELTKKNCRKPFKSRDCNARRYSSAWLFSSPISGNETSRRCVTNSRPVFVKIVFWRDAISAATWRLVASRGLNAGLASAVQHTLEKRSIMNRSKPGREVVLFVIVVVVGEVPAPLLRVVGDVGDDASAADDDAPPQRVAIWFNTVNAILAVGRSVASRAKTSTDVMSDSRLPWLANSRNISQGWIEGKTEDQGAYWN